jgi:hypothetical protein
MADAPKSPDDLDYEAMAQEALRGVIRAALKRAATPSGMPGAHHFYITFKTKAPGVAIPPELLDKYPEEMTIVLQHQYWDLTPGDAGFSVVLKFGGSPKKLMAPYAAVTRFYDPSVQFLLQFEPVEAPASGPLLTVVEDRPEPDEAPEAPAPDDAGPKIVSLDKFRKK